MEGKEPSTDPHEEERKDWVWRERKDFDQYIELFCTSSEMKWEMVFIIDKGGLYLKTFFFTFT